MILPIALSSAGVGASVGNNQVTLASFDRRQSRLVLVVGAIAIITAFLPVSINIFVPLNGGQPATTIRDAAPVLLVLHVVSNVTIGLSYVAISVMLIYMAKRLGRQMPFLWAFVAFGAFIVACGLTHFVTAMIVWEPLDWIASGVTYATAVISAGTAFMIPSLVPHAMGVVRAAGLNERYREELEQSNDSLATLSQRYRLELGLRARAEARLRESEERFRSSFEDAALGMAIVALDGRLLRVNPPMSDLFGYPEEALLSRSIVDLMHPDDRDGTMQDIERLRDGPRRHQSQRQCIRNDGSVFQGLSHLSLVSDDQGVPLHILVQIMDVTEPSRLQAELRHQAFHDTLTGLANRSLLSDRLQQAIAQARRYGNRVGIAFLDLDNFKLVNDSMGHDCGDEVLVEVASRITSCLRESDTVARFGGDEFVIVLSVVNSLQDVHDVCTRIQEELARPFTVPHREIVVTTSIGVVVSDDPLIGPARLLQQADTALYHAKHLGKNRMAVFTETMQDAALRRLDIEDHLRRAIDTSSLLIEYQPLVSLVTGHPVGVEALVRLRHPDLGVVSPDEFIPIAEETGLIRPMGTWVLEQSCRQTLLWDAIDSAPSGLVTSVNLSARQFQQPDLVEQVRHVLAETGISGKRVMLEITESVVMGDAEEAVQRLNALKSLGVSLAIDDFGTGYSSLAYLRRFPVDAVKIDRSFVRGVVENSEDRAIIVAMISLAGALHIDVVAEGIETIEQLTALRDLGCERAQGFLFSRPLPPDRITNVALGTSHDD